MSESLYLGFITLIPFIFLFIGILATDLKLHWITFAGMILTIVLSLIWKTSFLDILYSALEGIIIAIIPIIWVIAAAVFTYLVSTKTGAMEKIKSFLLEISPDRNIQAIIVAFCFGGFLESIAGFGTAVAIPTGILVSIGFKPVKAAIISLIANSVPVAFGALGLPVIVLSKITELNIQSLTKYVALQLLPFSTLIPLALVIVSNGSFRNILPSISDALIVGITFTLTQTLTAFFVGPELVALLGTMSAIAILVIVRTLEKRKISFNGLLISTSNYIVLLVLVFLFKVIFKDYLSKSPFFFDIFLGCNSVRIDYLTTPGTLLFISTVIGAFLQGGDYKMLKEISLETLNKIKWSSFTIVNILILAKIMGNTNMINDLATLIATTSGKLYPLFSGLVGAIGTFITGSDTSSNILFGELQKETAINIGVDESWIASSNTSGATAGKMISPQSIAVASSIAGLTGSERKILKFTIWFCLGYLTLLGIYVFLVSSLTLGV